MLASTLPKTIEMHADDIDCCGHILGNPTRISQALMNICVNAIDAMDSAAMDSTAVRSKGIFIRTWTTKDKHIHIGIKNTGPGIPADIQSKIFDPFFTTKPIGSGTGLGLSIAYQTLQNHNGSIRVNSEDSIGTEFIIDLPLNDDRPVLTDGHVEHLLLRQ